MDWIVSRVISRVTIIVFGVLMTASALAQPKSVTPRDASDFLETVGVNVHMGMPEVGNSGTTYNSIENIVRELSVIGVHFARDTLFIDSSLSKLKTISERLGIKFDLVYDYYGYDGSRALLDRALANIRTAPNLLDAVEGPNEPDWFGITFEGMTKAQGVIAAQKALFGSVKSDRIMKSIPVYCPALSYPAHGGMADSLGSLAAYCDYATAHPYMLNNSLGIYPPDRSLSIWLAVPSSVTAPGRPLSITEGGWTTCPNDAGGVDELTQAKYMLAYLLDAFDRGVHRTYLYELSDETADPDCHNPVAHYGLFDNNGGPKLAAKSLANLNAVLRGRSAHGQSLSYSITGLPAATGHQMLLQLGDGRFVLAMWNEGILWDRDSHARVTLPDVPVEVTLEKQPALMQLFDPIAGSRPLKTVRAVSSLSILVPDHPVLLLISLKR